MYSPALLPSSSRAAPAKNRMWSTMIGSSSRAYDSGLPTFADSISASSSAFSSSTRASASRSSERSPGVVSSHPGKAAFAASTAASTSSAEHRGTTPSPSPVAGVSTSLGWREAACTQLPPTRIPLAAAIPATLAHDHRSLHVIVDGADVVVRTGLGELELVPLDQGWPERVREDPRVVEPLAVPA